jgi:hypothetical protein
MSAHEVFRFVLPIVAMGAVLWFGAQDPTRLARPRLGVSLALVAGDLAVIGLAGISAQLHGYLVPNKYIATASDMWPNVGVIAAVTLVALYVFDLYNPDDVSRVQLASRVICALFLALLVAILATGVLGIKQPNMRLGSQAFSHIMGVTGLGVLLWRLAWMMLGPHMPNSSTTPQRPPTAPMDARVVNL